MLSEAYKFGDERLPERFWSKVLVNPATGCWEWQACIEKGYGRYRRDKTGMPRCHKVSYEALVGPIPEGLELDHLCRVKHCCNPLHLEAVTHAENIRRGDAGLVSGALQRAKTHCPKGHEYTEENTYHRPDDPESRGCRTCRNRATGVGTGGVQKAKTHCPKKHEYTPENTYVYVDKNGKIGRSCIICRRAADVRGREKKSQEKRLRAQDVLNV